eukprot:4595235-Pleurochrysis_carterae.AAC.2
MNGRRVRRLSASGGSWRARTSAKWQSVSAVDQSWPTDKSESRTDGTQRTPSLTMSGRSPNATQGRGQPSTPETDSGHATVNDKTNVPTMRTQAASVPIAESS